MADDPVLNAEIDIRSYFSPFDFPKLVEVIRAVEQQLPADRLKVVKQLRGALLGLYRITSNDYTLYEGKSVTIRDVKIPIILRKKQTRPPQEKTGILVTVYDAYDGKTRQIPCASCN